MAGTTGYGDFSVIKDNTEDSIVLKKTEIAKWQAEAADIFAKAKARATDYPVDPLFQRVANGDALYRQHSEGHRHINRGAGEPEVRWAW
jgi:hypothetical protein